MLFLACAAEGVISSLDAIISRALFFYCRTILLFVELFVELF